jgi:hypothetical protein
MVTSDISSELYVGNNSTTAPYPVPFYFFAETDLLVTSIDSLGTEQTLQLHTDYTVQGAGNQNGGSILTTFQVPTNWHVRIERIVEATQLTSYQEGDSFPALSHERALDKLTFLVQQTARTGGGGAGGGGKAWANETERQLTTPGFIGQLGFQVNTATIYYANSTTTGDWKKAIFDNLSAAPGQVPIFTTDAHLTNIVIDGIATLTGGVLGATAKPAGDLVGTTQPQTLTNKTLTSPVIDDPTGLDRMDVGLGNVDNTSDVNKPISNATQTSLDQKEATINKGQNGGYAGLDATGKVPLNQMPQSVLGANVYQGTWNAATNTPTIPPANLANQGWYWVVSVAGSTNIDGISTWAAGDWIISNGTAWERIINIDSVSSVNAMTGAVVVTKSHVGLSNVDNTSDATKNAAAATLTNKTLTSPAINSPTGLVKADVGLGNVDNTSDATKNAASATLTNKTIDGANNALRVRLDTTDVVNNLPVSHLNGGSGAGPTTFWRGDGSWAPPAGGGDVTGPAGAIAGEFATYANSTGKLLSRSAPPMLVGDTAQNQNPANSIIVPSFANHPDRIFASPIVFDDHFEGTSLDAKWTVVAPDALRTVAVGGSNVAFGSQSILNDSVQYICSITQSLPNANNFRLTLKLDAYAWPHTITGGLAYVDIVVSSVTPSVQGLRVRYQGQLVAGVGNFETVTLFTGLNMNTSYVTFYGRLGMPYVRFVWTRADWKIKIYGSLNGVVWTQIFFEIPSANSGLSESILPTRFQLAAGSINLGQAMASSDWVTFVNF